MKKPKRKAKPNVSMPGVTISKMQLEIDSLRCELQTIYSAFTIISTGQRPVYEALRELLAYYDRRDDSGWTAVDVKRIAEIRKLCP